MLYKNILFPPLCALSRDDAERAHELALWFLQSPVVSRALHDLKGPSHSKPIEVFGVRFPNQVGLAAGFDKNAVALLSLQQLFGFLEIGTVTPRPQAGNERPRLFRLLEDKAVINRMGFNNEGAIAVAANIRKARPKICVPIGGSLGKMKETPNEEALQDYIEVMRVLWPYVDYFVANVSSPNTTNLRELQAQAPLEELLRGLIEAEQQELSHFPKHRKRPVLVKIAPDLAWDEVEQIVGVCTDMNIDGIVACNTTVGREGLTSSACHEQGGASGPLLFKRVCEIVSFIHVKAPSLPIIGVGGISSPDDAARVLDAGASLIQLFTGLIYEGPRLPFRITAHLSER